MLADLFKSSKPVVPEGEPKNIEVLQQLAKPLARHKSNKFVEELEKEMEAAKNAPKPHDLPEPKNLTFLEHLAKPIPRLTAKKFEDEMAEIKKKPSKIREMPEPANIERLQEMAKPLKKSVPQQHTHTLTRNEREYLLCEGFESRINYEANSHTI